MSLRERYTPGPAHDARIEKDGETWTLVLVREMRHAPEMVWDALTDPAQLSQWAPFDASGHMGATGATATLTTVGAPAPHVTETTVTRADPPRLLVYNWGGNDMRWELEPSVAGTRLTLWTRIDRRFIAMGAAGWHVCLDVLAYLLDGRPLGRIAGMEVMQFEGWQRLHKEYGAQFATSFADRDASGLS